MPGSEADEAKTLDELMKKIVAQQKQTAEMLKQLELQKKMQNQKLMLELLANVQKAQDSFAKKVAKDIR
jgi:hypothetical protein